MKTDIEYNNQILHFCVDYARFIEKNSKKVKKLVKIFKKNNVLISSETYEILKSANDHLLSALEILETVDKSMGNKL